MTKLSFNKKTNVTPKLVHDQELWAEDVNEMMDLLEELYTSVLNFQNAQAVQTFAEAWPVGGMNVRGYATNYPILDQFYNAIPKTVTHAAAPTTVGWGRIDAVVADVQGEVLIIQGDAGAVFTEPTVDATTHYLIRYFLILANATSPVDPITGNKPAVSLVAYRENLGDAGGEANASGSNVSINVNSANSLIGSIGIEATNPQKMHKAVFAWPVMQSTVGITHLQYILELKAIVDPSKYWFIGLLKNGKRITNSWFLFKDSQYGFNASSLLEQTILIPIEATPFQNVDFNGLEIFFYHGSNTIPGYFMDNIEFLNGISTNPNIPETTDYKLYASGDARIGLYKNLVLNSEIDLRTAVQPNHLEYVSQAAMIAGQSMQRTKYQYFDGTSTWQYLGTTLGTIADYRIISGGGEVAADYTIDIVANQLKLYKDAVEVGSKDLSIYLDDTNLARLTSGILNATTGIATFTRDDASTFTLDLSNLLDNQTAAEVSVDSAAFTGNLAVTDNTVQKVAEKVDALVLGGTNSVTQSTGNIIDLSNVLGTYYNMLLANSATTYTFVNQIVGGKAIVLINATSEPIITSATKTKGYVFVPNETIYMTVWFNGNRVEYYFTEINNETLIDLTALPYGAKIAESTVANHYYGTPAILKTSSGRTLMSLSHFGSATTDATVGVTSVYYSDNININNFQFISDVSNMFWATLFEYSGSIYLLGVSKLYGNVTISKSIDDGLTWSTAVTVLTAPIGTFTYRGWNMSADNVIFKDGYLVCSIEAVRATVAGTNWANHFDACVVFANLENLLTPTNWSYSNIVAFNGATLETNLIAKNAIATKQPANETAYKGFLEGSLIELTSGNLRMFMRLEQTPNSNHALYMDVTWNGTTPPSSVLGSTQNYIDLLGGNVNFQVKYDATSGKHWTIVNANRYKYFTDQRTECYLASSSDQGLTWNYHGKILGYDVTSANWESIMAQYAVSYSCFEIVGNDLVIASRTADVNAANYHDTNLLTLSVFKNFRSATAQTFVNGSLIIDENSERLEDANGISLIRDQSVNHNSPFMLTSDNASKPNWVTNGIQFDGASWLRLMHSEKLSLSYGTGMSVFVVIENLQVEFYRRILANDNGVDQELVVGKGGWWVSPENGFGIEQSYPTYQDLTAGNNYILATTFDKTNRFIYNYKNGVNRGNPTGSNVNITWDTDHLVTSVAYSGTNYKEILIGKRNIGVSKLHFTSKIKALHIIPGFMTPAQMVSYMNALNAIYSIY